MSLRTTEEKLALYRAHKYRCRVPDVTHALWTDEDWVRWIEHNGVWLP